MIVGIYMGDSAVSTPFYQLAFLLNFECIYLQAFSLLYTP